MAQLSKGASRAVVADALKMLARMAHRGACGCEENTGELCFASLARVQRTRGLRQPLAWVLRTGALPYCSR